MQAQYREAITIHGISVRTNNRTESAPGGHIPALWQRYLTEHLQPDAQIVAVYSDYASDVNGDYTLTIGSAQQQNAEAVAELVAGHYLAFEVQGAMPEAVIQGWQSVWAYFADPASEPRAYRSDAEVYHGPDSATIYIGILPPAA